MLKLKTFAWKIKLQKSEKSSYKMCFHLIYLIKDLKLKNIFKFLQINKQKGEKNTAYQHE